MSYSYQLDQIQELIADQPDLQDDIYSEEHVRPNVTYRRDSDNVEVVIDPAGTIERDRFQSLMEQEYAPPHSKRYRLEQEGDQYTVESIPGDSFNVEIRDDQAHLHFDGEDSKWAFREGKRIASLLEQ